jgi:hypothetical protein
MGKNKQAQKTVWLSFLTVALKLVHNVISLGEVADFGKIKFQLKNKYNAKRKRE